ncbi:MAG: helix-turn-helix transcriptional regulator [Dechloromonas sp.]|jgi:DNA-binding transcriptional ArsR family regulator|nr:helix-turn-helix transcriptional regulator [Dechloromonas sp.]
MDETQAVFERVARYFGLLSDPTRLRILSCMCNQERSVGEIVDIIGLSQPNISRHLGILFEAEVIDKRREGTTIYYRVIDPDFTDICRTVSIRVASCDFPTGQKDGEDKA